MPYSKFLQIFKCARMIQAQEQLASIEASSFQSYDKQNKSTVVKRLEKRSKEFLDLTPKSFSEFVNDLAKKMVSRGRR